MVAEVISKSSRATGDLADAGRKMIEKHAPKDA